MKVDIRSISLLAGRLGIGSRQASAALWATMGSNIKETPPVVVVSNPVHVRDFHATVPHLLGSHHGQFSYQFQRLDQRLTGVEPARVLKETPAEHGGEHQFLHDLRVPNAEVRCGLPTIQRVFHAQ